MAPGTGELVSCGPTYTGPLMYAKNLKRILDTGTITIEELATKIDLPSAEIRRKLWLLMLSSEQQKRVLVDMFIDLIGTKVSNDDEWLGKLKAILKEIILIKGN